MWTLLRVTGRAKSNNMPKHVFFDMDDTLTKSKTLMAPEHAPLFRSLCGKKDVIIVSGQDIDNIRRQIPTECDGLYFVLTQNGNHALAKDGSVLWSRDFSNEQKTLIYEFANELKKELHLEVKDENDLIEDRGSQISYSLIGHHEDLQKKREFDPGAKKRIAILEDHSSWVTKLRDASIEVAAGGTTCFDFMLLGCNKGSNVLRLTEREGWKKEDSLYVGDALEPGRNDETVIGVIPTHAVKDPDETFGFIKSNLL